MKAERNFEDFCDEPAWAAGMGMERSDREASVDTCIGSVYEGSQNGNSVIDGYLDLKMKNAGIPTLQSCADESSRRRLLMERINCAAGGHAF